MSKILGMRFRISKLMNEEEGGQFKEVLNIVHKLSSGYYGYILPDYAYSYKFDDDILFIGFSTDFAGITSFLDLVRMFEWFNDARLPWLTIEEEEHLTPCVFE